MLLQIGRVARALETSEYPPKTLRTNLGFLRTSPEFVIRPRGKFVKATLMPPNPLPLKQPECRRRVASGVLNSRTRARLITEELYRTWAGRRSKTNRWAINLKLMNLCPSFRDFEIAGNFAFGLPLPLCPLPPAAVIKGTSFRAETKCGELKAKSLRTLYSANFGASSTAESGRRRPAGTCDLINSGIISAAVVRLAAAFISSPIARKSSRPKCLNGETTF